MPSRGGEGASVREVEALDGVGTEETGEEEGGGREVWGDGIWQQRGVGRRNGGWEVGGGAGNEGRGGGGELGLGDLVSRTDIPPWDPKISIPRRYAAVHQIFPLRESSRKWVKFEL